MGLRAGAAPEAAGEAEALAAGLAKGDCHVRPKPWTLQPSSATWTKGCAFAATSGGTSPATAPDGGGEGHLKPSPGAMPGVSKAAATSPGEAKAVQGGPSRAVAGKAPTLELL